MAFRARKPMTLLGIRYSAGTPVRLDNVRPALRRRLIEMRRVVPHVAESAADVQQHVEHDAGRGVSIGESVEKVLCSETSKSTGKPCRRDATAEDGLCAIHRRALSLHKANQEG